MSTITAAVVACTLLGWFQQGLNLPVGPMDLGAPTPGLSAPGLGVQGGSGNGNGNGNIGNGNGNGNSGNNNGNGNVGNGNGNGFSSDNNGNGPLAGSEGWWGGAAPPQGDCAATPGG